MKRLFTIAAGVFLGGMALFVVIKIPEWRENAIQEEIKEENDKAWMALLLMTPEKLIAQCGKPAREEIQNIGQAQVNRRMLYKSPVNSSESDQSMLVFFFLTTESPSSSKLITSLMSICPGGIDKHGRIYGCVIDSENYFSQERASMARKELPCLDPQASSQQKQKANP